MELKTAVLNRLDEIKKLRATLHENAELSFNEFKTQRIIIDYLEALGYSCKACANTGVIALINSGAECIAVRADMDALPINGAFHGCGHDYHMAILLGVAAVLKDLNFKKCIKFIFQPGEEASGGAVPMIKEGVLENPKVKSMVGYHVWPGLKVGTIEAAYGASMGSVDDFIIKFIGRGGHAAMPEQCINPLQPAIRFAAALEEKSNKMYMAKNPHVLTVSSLNCGTAPNVISDSAVVMGTVRTFEENLRSCLKDEILGLAAYWSKTFQCDVDINYDEQYPPLINDKSITDSFIASASKLLGKGKVLPLKPTFAAEDFSYFAKAVPAVHFRLGIADDVLGNYPLHSPHFNANEDAIFNGIHLITHYLFNV